MFQLLRLSKKENKYSVLVEYENEWNELGRHHTVVESWMAVLNFIEDHQRKYIVRQIHRFLYGCSNMISKDQEEKRKTFDRLVKLLEFRPDESVGSICNSIQYCREYLNAISPDPDSRIYEFAARVKESILEFAAEVIATGTRKEEEVEFNAPKVSQ